jgi:hypothetical protein
LKVNEMVRKLSKDATLGNNVIAIPAPSSRSHDSDEISSQKPFEFTENYINFDLEIIDFGRGIPPSAQKDLFINFSKLGES